MKQVFCFLLIFAMICSVFTVFAEDSFSFRNGISIEDSIEDVIAKEKTDCEKHTDSRGMQVLTYNNLVLSSISDSSLEYYFNDEHLDFIFLVYGKQRLMLLNNEYHTYNYKLIEDGLITKYGEMDPEFSLDNIQTYYGCVLNNVKTNEPQNVVEWSHREIPTSNGKTIIIEHLLLGRPFYGEVRYGHYLSYKIVSPGEESVDLVTSDL